MVSGCFVPPRRGDSNASEADEAGVDTELRDAFNSFIEADDISTILDHFEDVLLLTGVKSDGG